MSGQRPALTVVVCSLGRAQHRQTVASLLASAERAALPVQVLLVWQAPGEPHGVTGCDVVEAYPVNLSNARNVGLARAEAELVAFVDDDEQVDPGYVRGAVAAFAEDDTVAAFGPVDPLDDRGLAYCSSAGGEAARHTGEETPPWKVGTGGNMAFRTTALRRIGGFDLRFGAGSPGRSAEDLDVIVRLQQAGATLLWTPDMVVYHPTKTAEERLASRRPYGFGMSRVATRRRSARVAGQIALALGHASREVARTRSRRRLRELGATTAGIAAGVWQGRRWPAPELDVSTLPAAIACALEGRSLTPLETPHRGDAHFLYAGGPDRVLHLYTWPTPMLERALEARRMLAAQDGLDGIPALHGAALERSALWVVEDRVLGKMADHRNIGEWWDAACAWAVAAGRCEGRPLEETSWWQTAETLPEIVSPPWRAAVADALSILRELPSRVAHGDFQPKNIVVDQGRLSVVDWETASAEYLPGFDLVFLASMARGHRPEAAVLSDLAAGREPAGLPVLGALAAVGVGPRELPAILVASLAEWVRAERDRLEQAGVEPQQPLYGPLMDTVMPAITLAESARR